MPRLLQILNLASFTSCCEMGAIILVLYGPNLMEKVSVGPVRYHRDHCRGQLCSCSMLDITVAIC